VIVLSLIGGMVSTSILYVIAERIGSTSNKLQLNQMKKQKDASRSSTNAPEIARYTLLTVDTFGMV